MHTQYTRLEDLGGPVESMRDFLVSPTVLLLILRFREEALVESDLLETRSREAVGWGLGKGKTMIKSWRQ